MTGEDAYIETEREHFAQLRERAEVAEAKVAAALSSEELLAAVIAGTCANDLRRNPPHPTCVLAANAAIRALRAALADRPAGGEATTRAPSIGTEPYRGKG